MMKKYDLIIAGGCSSGLAAAINAARTHKNIKIAIIEQLPRLGKKILATGNGRCNLTNINAVSHNYRNRDFALNALNKYPPESIIKFFESTGLLTRTDGEGRVYPRSNTASSVLDALRFEIEKYGIDVFCNTKITGINRKNDLFIVNGEFSAKKLIIACGGKSSPSQGSDGSIFNIIKTLGHGFTALSPALTPLICQKNETKPLKGIRVPGVELTAVCDGKILCKSKGEILFTDSGISGIAAMELAGDINSCVKGNAFTYVDFVPEMTIEELSEYIEKLLYIRKELTVDELLTGIVPKMAGAFICKASGLYTSAKSISELNHNDCITLAAALKKCVFTVRKTNDFSNSQVTRGGINVDEIYKDTMQSKICKGLYFAGEIIDIDGGCGGFNLQWAWSSGMLAGELL